MSSKEKDTKSQEELEDEEIVEIEKLVNDSKPQNGEKKKENVEKETKEVKQEPKINQEKKEEVEQEEKEDKHEKNHKLWLLFLTLVIIILIAIFSTIFALLNLGKPTIAKGITIKGIDVSNLTTSEATQKLNEAINVELMLGMDLVYSEEYKVDFDVNQIQYSYDVSDAVKKAYEVGRTGNILTNNYTLLGTAFFGKDIEISSDYNEESLNGIVDDVSSKVPGLVVQASYYREGDKLIIENGTAGITVKKEELKNDIINKIKERNALEILKNDAKQVVQIQTENVTPDPIDVEKIYHEIYSEPKDAYYVPEPFQIFREEEGVDFAVSLDEAKAIIAAEENEEYTIPLKITPAEKTIDDIGLEAFPYVISSYSTKYDASNVNRSDNLKLAAGKINGTVLMPGEEFSYNEVVGKRTIEDGYKNAKIYENGQVVDGLAGGICQISSTLYNAVLLANLEVTERRNHSYTTSYVPAGRDATVVYGTQDFKFRNSRTYPIKIEAKVANGIAEFAIHGIREEIEYDIRIIPVTTQTIPYATEYIPDPTLVPGQQVVEQMGHSGYKVTTYIEKRLAGAVVSKEVLTNDTYNPMKTVVRVFP